MADIHSKVPSDDYRSNYDAIFGKAEAADSKTEVVEASEAFVVVGEFCKDKIQFFSGGQAVIEISNGAFYVRGKRVEQNAGEAPAVYKAFKDLIGVDSNALVEVPNAE